MNANSNEIYGHRRDLFVEVPTLVWAGKMPPATVPCPPVRLVETYRFPIGATKSEASFGEEWLTSDQLGGLLFHGDNRDLLAYLDGSGFRGRVNLVYADPPFRSGGEYGREVVLRGPSVPTAHAARKRSIGRRLQYTDVWEANDYLQFIYERLLMLRELMADGGSIFLHCDHRASHHLRCLLDEIMGVEGFRNEIVWTYSAGARGAKAIAGQFGRNHDVILWYQKGQPSPRHKADEGNGDRGFYRPIYFERRVPFNLAQTAGYHRDAEGRWFKTAPRGDYTDESISALEQEGRIYRTRGGNIRVKYFLRQDGDHIVEDVMLGDVWSDIADAMHLPAGERTGFHTQKPVALLERIIAACSSPGDLVLDCFGGSGTTAMAARKLGRRWICGDASESAIAITRQRLLRTESSDGYSVYDVGANKEVSPDGARLNASASLDVKREGGAVILEILDFTSPAIAQRLRQQGNDHLAMVDWRAIVDSVLIDAGYDGAFRITVADVPARKSDLVLGKYRFDAAPGAVVAVKICDILGDEVMVVKTAP